jgi:hypothetical protein
LSSCPPIPSGINCKGTRNPAGGQMSKKDGYALAA